MSPNQKETGDEEASVAILPSDDDYLFDAALLQQLNWNEHHTSLRHSISPANPGEHLVMRPLRITDFDRGFTDLLGQLTDIGDLTSVKFAERFHCMKSCPETYFTIVLEDWRTSMLAGVATLVIEQKFIHGAATRGRIEDVVVSEDYRGQQLGKLLVETLTVLARDIGCYKVSLECKDENVKFYESLGFAGDQNYMVQRFDGK